MTPVALADLVRSVAVEVLTGRGLDAAVLPATVSVERPRDPGHGDYATTVALQSAKPAGVAPREFAGWLAEALVQHPAVRAAEVAGPGFLNLRLAPEAQVEVVAQVLAAGDRFGALQGRPTPRLAGLDEPPTAGAVQYAHARLAALARNAPDLGISSDGAQLGLLVHQAEGTLIRTLAEFPRIAAAAAATAAGTSGAAPRREPHRVVRYLEQLADDGPRFAATCRVLPVGDEQPGPVHAARLALCQATRQVLANGLRLLGVAAPERM